MVSKCFNFLDNFLPLETKYLGSEKSKNRLPKMSDLTSESNSTFWNHTGTILNSQIIFQKIKFDCLILLNCVSWPYAIL